MFQKNTPKKKMGILGVLKIIINKKKVTTFEFQ